MESLKAPNGKPSNLTAEQYKLVRTPQFKKWFGDWENDPANASKVVDENGEPLVVYHGSNSSFHSFNSRLHFFTNDISLAEYFVKENYGSVENRVPSVYRCFLNFRNPFVMPFTNSWADVEISYFIKSFGEELFLELLEFEFGNYDSIEDYYEQREPITIDQISLFLKSKGLVDGVIAKDIGETANAVWNTDDYIAFESNQIKLADGKNTTFDGSNSDIRFDDGGEIKQESLKIIIKNVTNSNKYSGAYKKIFDIIEEDITFYSPYGTESEDLIGNDFHIIITPRPEQGLIEKIRKIKNVVIVDDGYAKGGSIKRYKKDIMKKVKKGGITYGRSHAEGGIPVKNASTGDMLEVEGGEGIVNKRSMASGKKVKLNGKDMSLCEAVSQLNQMEGGVQFNCDDVADRQFIEEMALGGELERGTRTEKEHIQVLRDLYAKRITPEQATKKIAKDHLKEDKRYYSKLAKMEGKMAKGGMITDADGLKGHIVKFYEQGVKDPNFYTIAKAYYSDPSYRFKTLSIDFVGGGTEVLSEGQIEAFLKGEQVQMKTYGKYDFYAIQLTPRKMKNGGQTTDCGCGLTYAEGGFVEDNTPLEVGDVVYVIDNAKPRNEWLRGVYVEKAGENAKVVITDADANQFEKTISFDKLIKLDIAQANPSDFKLFNQEFSKAKDNYFESVSKIGIVQEKINRAKMFPDKDPEKQKQIMAYLKYELSKAENFKTKSSNELSDVKNVPSAFYRYAEGGVVTMDDFKNNVLKGNNIYEQDFKTISLRNVFPHNIGFKDLSVPVLERNKIVGVYSYDPNELPNTFVKFIIEDSGSDSIMLSFNVSSRLIRNKNLGWHEVSHILSKLGFIYGQSDLTWAVSNDTKTRSKRFTFYFRKDYYNLFRSNTAIRDLLTLFEIFVLMLILDTPFLRLEDMNGRTINSVLEVFKNKKIEKNEGDSGSGSGGNIDKIKEFLETYNEQELNPKAWKPKTGESEVSGALRRMVSKGLITKAEWDECVKVTKTMNDLVEKVKDLPADSVLYKVVTPKIYDQVMFLTEKSQNIIKDLDSLESLKYTSDEKIDFPILMMKIWGHEPSLDSSIFE